jgi:hypothetical protein
MEVAGREEHIEQKGDTQDVIEAGIGSVPQFLLPPNFVLLSKRLDAVLDLLVATTDAPAALEVGEASEADRFCFPSIIQ